MEKKLLSFIINPEAFKKYKVINIKKEWIKIATLKCCMILSVKLFAQCPAPSAILSCTPVGSSALVSNDLVGSGQVKTVNANLSLGTPTISGGILLVCANLTITGISFTSGTIIVNPGATLFLNPPGSVVFGSNCVIQNHGIFSTTGSLVTGQNNLIVNCNTSSVFNILFNQLVVQGPNTAIINYGVINSGYVINSSSNSPNTYCLGPSSMINANIMINQYANAFTCPTSHACISIASQIINSQSMTATPNVKVCYKATGPGSVNVIGSPNFGSATVNSTCTSCSVALPLDLISFTGICTDENIQLKWVTANEKNSDYFLVQKSSDGLNYITLERIVAKGESQTVNVYSYSENGLALDREAVYYRLKQVDRSEDYKYSPVVHVACNIDEALLLFPQIVKERVFTLVSQIGLMDVNVIDMQGKRVFKDAGNNDPVKVIVLSHTLPAGIYVVVITSSSGVISRKKIIVP